MTCLLTGMGAAHAVEIDKEITLEIAENTPLGQALLQWSTVTGIQTESSSQLVAGLKAGPIHGTLSARAALSQLLQKAGLDYRVANESVVIIRVDPAAAKAGTGEGQSAPTAQKSGTLGSDGGREPRSGDPGSNGPKLEMVVISGTHIDGAGPASMVIAADRESIQRSGSQSMGEFMQKQPQNFAGGSNANVIGAGGRTNMRSPSGAYTANIRGLGSESTLTLLNGFRLAWSADSSAVDMNQIPLAAIKQVDIIPNGETAVYGADAVAGVVNVIPRDDYNGLEASAALGGATEGGGRLWQYDLVGGTDWPNGHGLFCFHMGQQSDVDASQRSYLAHSLDGTSLVPETRNISGLMSLKQQLTLRTSVALMGLVTSRSDHRTENVGSQVPGLAETEKAKVHQYAIMASTETALPRNWKMRVSGEVASDDAVVPESLTLFDKPFFESDSTFNNRLRSVQADFNGKLGPLLGGATGWAVGGGYRDEGFAFTGPRGGTLRFGHKRGIGFGFAEADLPLLAAADQEANAPLLDLRLAGRLDAYKDLGSSANPKITLTYRPLRDLQLRASWGTSFRAPTLVQKYDVPQATLEIVPDPSAPGGQSTVLQRFGGNGRLGPERSSTSSFDLKWAAWTGLSIEIAYYYIDYHARIGIPTTDNSDPFSDPNSARFVTRYPSVADLAAVIEESAFINRTAAPYDPNTVAAVIDDRYHNIIWQRASGFDFLSSYEKETEMGRLDAQIGYTRHMSGFWHSARVELTAQNLFDRKPPFIPADPTAFPPLNVDTTNASPIGRSVVFRVSGTW